MLQQYALLGLFAVAAYGWGYPLTRWIPTSEHSVRLITITFRLASGMGVLMGLLIVMAGLG